MFFPGSNCYASTLDNRSDPLSSVQGRGGVWKVISLCVVKTVNVDRRDHQCEQQEKLAFREPEEAGTGGILSTAISSRSLCFAPLRLYSCLEKPRVNNGSSRGDESSTNNKGVQRSMSVFHKQQIVQRSMISLPQTTNEYSRVWSVFHKQQNTTEYGQSSTNNRVQRSMASLPQTTNEYSGVWSIFHKQRMNTADYGQSSTNNK